MVHEAFRSKNASGWSLPLSDRNAMVDYAKSLEFLYTYYARANQDLYALLGTMGPASGWSGAFPTAHTPRKVLSHRNRAIR